MTAELVTTFPRRTLPVGDGDTEFEQFYARYYPCLLGWAWKQFGAADAEDIAQETLARAFANFGRLDPDRDPWPWLIVVARRIGTDAVRAHARTVAVEDQRLADMPDADGDTPVDHVLASADRRTLRTALAELSPNDRRVLRLREYDDLSSSDIAALLDCSETAVRQQLFRARRRLAERFRANNGSFVGLLPVALLGLRRRFGRMATQALGGATSVCAIATSALVVAGSGAMVVGMNQTPRVVGIGGSTSAANAGTSTHDGRPDRPAGYRAGGAGTPAGGSAYRTPTPEAEARTALDIESRSEENPFAPNAEEEHSVRVVILGHHVVGVGTGGQNPNDYGPVCSTAVVVCE